MKLNIATIVAIALSASSAFAQTSVTTEAAAESSQEISSKGFRIALVKPILDLKIQAKALGYTFTNSDQLDSVNGFSAGYASFPIQKLGWNTNLTYMDVRNNDSTGGLVRLDGNLGYTMNRIFNVKGGINVSNITQNNNQDLKAGLGFQSSFGIQITKVFGIDLGYTYMSQNAKVGIVEIDVIEAGPEIGISATF